MTSQYALLSFCWAVMPCSDRWKCHCKGQVDICNEGHEVILYVFAPKGHKSCKHMLLGADRRVLHDCSNTTDSAVLRRECSIFKCSDKWIVLHTKLKSRCYLCLLCYYKVRDETGANTHQSTDDLSSTGFRARAYLCDFITGWVKGQHKTYCNILAFYKQE